MDAEIEVLFLQLEEHLEVAQASLEGVAAEMDAVVTAERERCAQIVESAYLPRENFHLGDAAYDLLETLSAEIRSGK